MDCGNGIVFSGERPGWSAQSLLGAALLTLLLFGLLPLAHVLNQPDVDQLIALRDVDTALLPPPRPTPFVEPAPTPERRPEPIQLELPSPAPTPESARPLPVPSMPLPSFQGDFGAAIGGLDWTVFAGVYTLAEVDAPPRPLVQAPPMYPQSARQSGLEGQVDLEFVVTETGAVTDVRVIDARPGTVFISSARSAVERWRFEPARRGGEPVAVRVEVPLQFRLDR